MVAELVHALLRARNRSDSDLLINGPAHIASAHPSLSSAFPVHLLPSNHYRVHFLRLLQPHRKARYQAAKPPTHHGYPCVRSEGTSLARLKTSLAGIQFENSSDIGVFSKLTNSYCLCAIQGSTNFYSAFESELGDVVPIVHTSIGGTRIIGRLTAGVLARAASFPRTPSSNPCLAPLRQPPWLAGTLHDNRSGTPAPAKLPPRCRRDPARGGATIRAWERDCLQRLRRIGAPRYRPRNRGDHRGRAQGRGLPTDDRRQRARR